MSMNYRGYEIDYAEDVYSCHELGILNHDLKLLQKCIDLIIKTRDLT